MKSPVYIRAKRNKAIHTFLGLLAKIKCSICSLEFDNSNGGHCPPCYLTYFSGGLPNSDACIAGLAAWPWHCTTALAEHPLNKKLLTKRTNPPPKNKEISQNSLNYARNQTTNAKLTQYMSFHVALYIAE